MVLHTQTHTHTHTYSDRQLSMEAPGIRKSLERLIFRMKSMVAGSDFRESKQVWVSTYMHEEKRYTLRDREEGKGL